MKHASAFILASLVSAACVASTPPPQPPPPVQPPVADPVVGPPPAVKPVPVQPLLNWCDPDAPPIYAETARRRNDAIANQVKLVLRQRGAWSYSVGTRLLKTGCLLRPQQNHFIRTLHGASFKTPPRPLATCDAVPSRFIRYFDMRRRLRSAFSSAPCGIRASADVYRVSALIHKHVGPSPAAPVVVAKPSPTPIGPRCLMMHTWGPVIYSEQTRSIRFNRIRSGKPAPRRPRAKPIMRRPNRRNLTIYANGAWRSVGFGKAKRGCLSRTIIAQVRRLTAAAQFRSNPRQRIRCRAIPSLATTISAKRKRFTFRHPCGAALHPTLSRLRNFIYRHVRR